jgi:MoaA/NifB/PqqE/SkfB family radical SAM enzyme
MAAADVERWLQLAAGYRNGHIQSVVVTGGEPFYNLPLLQQVLGSAQRNGLVPAVVTNAFWARDEAEAVAVLEGLPQIRMLSISADAYHQKAIPFHNVANAILAARRLGIKHNVAVCFTHEDDPVYLSVKQKLEEITEPELIRSAAIYPAGRAARRFEREVDGMTEEPPCGACTAADSPIIFPDGRVIGCMGIVNRIPPNHPVSLGSLQQKTLVQILDESERNVALHILRVWGPGRLLELLEAAGYGERLPRRFRKHGYCDLCYALASDEELAHGLESVASDKDLAEKTAWARLYYMNEDTMIGRLDGPAIPAAPGNGIAAGQKETEPEFLDNIAFMVTYKCQIACPHCIIGAGPNRKEEMTTGDIFTWIGAAASYREGKIKAVCFTGGEPFYDVDRLRLMSLFAVSRGMVPTVVTNAYWADTPEKALETLESLPALRVISVSTDSHHLAQIPFDRVANALTAARELRLNYRVAVCTEDDASPQHQELLERLERVVDRECIRVAITSPVGRASGFVNLSKYPMTDERPNSACPSAHSPVIFPDGRVVACVGPVIDLAGEHPLMLGNLRNKPLAAIMEEAEMNPVLHILRVWGPGRLCEILEEKGLGGRLPRRFIKDSICDLCSSIMGDPGLREALNGLAGESELMTKIAWAREYYLGETTMIERIHPALPATPPPGKEVQ